MSPHRETTSDLEHANHPQKSSEKVRPLDIFGCFPPHPARHEKKGNEDYRPSTADENQPASHATKISLEQNHGG